MPLIRRCRYRVHQEVKTKCEKAWTNKQILGEVFRPIIKSDYEKAGDQKTRQELIEVLEHPDPTYIFWKLVHLQFDALSFFVAYFDGAAGPTEWPGVDLVNARTRGTLSGDFGLDFAHFDGVYTEENAIPGDPVVLEAFRKSLQKRLADLRAAPGFQVREDFCPFCGWQSALLFIAYTDKNVIVVKCNECAAVWGDPGAVHRHNALRPHPLTLIAPELNCLWDFARRATREEIVAQGWEAYMQE